MPDEDAQWGDDDPRLKRDTTRDEKKAREMAERATGSRTYGMVGSYCDLCGGKDGAHVKRCRRNN